MDRPDRTPVGMVHGRFQPFHNGHLEYCLEAASRCELLVVGVTNPDPSRISPEKEDPHRSTPQSNPFPYHARARMVRLSLAAADHDPSSLQVVPLPIHDVELWPAYVPATAVQFMRIYSAWDERKAQRFAAAGFVVVDLSAGRAKEVSGTTVRARWRADDGWQSLVPPAVVQIVAPETPARR